MQIRFRMAFGILVVITLALFIIQRRITTNYEKNNKPIHTESNSDVRIVTTMYIAVVACGNKFQEALTMIKSALIHNKYNDGLTFLIFTEDSLAEQFRETLNAWKHVLKENFDFQLLNLSFPQGGQIQWRNLFKPCASQRLFIPSLLQTIDAVLYVDTDVIFISPISDIWQYFIKFNASQIAALSPEHEDANIGWYNRFARHPYYGNLGVNSGVMLMNLTRMRHFQWESHIIPIQRKYNLRITWGDQDIINILFYFHPEKLYIIPCPYNYRPDHCMYANACDVAVSRIKIIHGNRGYFHSNKQPLFRTMYDCFQNYHIDSTPLDEFLLSFEEALGKQEIKDTNCGRVASGIFNASKFVINNKKLEV